MSVSSGLDVTIPLNSRTVQTSPAYAGSATVTEVRPPAIPDIRKTTPEAFEVPELVNKVVAPETVTVLYSQAIRRELPAPVAAKVIGQSVCDVPLDNSS